MPWRARQALDTRINLHGHDRGFIVRPRSGHAARSRRGPRVRLESGIACSQDFRRGARAPNRPRWTRSTAAAKIATIGPEIIGGAGGCSAAAPKVMYRRGTTITHNLAEASPAGHDECSDDRLTDEQERQGEPGAKTK